MQYPQTAYPVLVLTPTAAATAALTANVDCQGANFATINVALGIELNTDSTNVAIQLSEADDTDASNFATFHAAFNRTVDNTAAVVAANHIDLRGRKRYIKLTVTPDTTTNGPVTIAAVADLYKDVVSDDASDQGDVVIG